MRVFSLAGIQPSPLAGISQSLVWVNPDRLLGEGSLNINSNTTVPFELSQTKDFQRAL